MQLRHLSALPVPDTLCVATGIAAGFAFGGFQGAVPAVASEIFGLKHLATNYSLLQLAPAFCAPAPLRCPHLWHDSG